VRPEFGERPGDLNVTTFAGQTAHLPCTVKHLAGKRVSWIRGRDLQVLSTGRITFSTDVRISVLPGSSGKVKSRNRRNVHTNVEVEVVEVKGRGTDETPRRGNQKRNPANSSPPLLSRLARRRRRALEWPSWTTDYFYPFHHDEDTISGLGGSPAWFHRQLARFNSEGSRSYTDHLNPIAIYPQGPLTHDPQAKGHVPGPNYIEGVWEPEDYTLQIKYTKPEDAGTYICQINTEPRITQVVHLSVVNMRAEIVGSRELYVKAGTPVTLACKVNHGTLMPGE
ncbi:hypothetical protein O3P69_011903, partial [Scylla paramamosain]